MSSEDHDATPSGTARLTRLPDGVLAAFVERLAARISPFSSNALRAVKKLLNRHARAAAAELALSEKRIYKLVAGFGGVGRFAEQSRRDLQQPSEYQRHARLCVTASRRTPVLPFAF